jgi:natural product biosynthesis luciferase-like monooxygenase protein
VDNIGLSPIQQGMLYHHVRDPHSGVDIEQMVARLHERIDPSAFRRAWQDLSDRHEVFRGSFRWNGLTQPVQVIHAHAEIGWEQRDLRGLADEERAATLSYFLRSDRERGFDLNVPPLMRGTLFQIDDSEWEFVWTFHHISADGQTYLKLIHEAFACYEALRDGKEPQFSQPPAFQSYSHWLEEHLVRIHERGRTFWQDTLRGFTEPTPLPRATGGRSLEAGYSEQSLILSEAATRVLGAFAAAHDITMSTLIHAAWATLLGAHGNTQDIVFGETRACRRNTVAGAEDIVGTMINTVPIRIRREPEMRVVDWLKSIRAFQIAVREFEHTPLPDIQGWSEVSAKTPLFESLVVFTPRLIGAALRDEGGAWRNREVRFLEQTNYPLTLFAYNERALLLKLAYDRQHFSEATIARCLKQLKTLLEALPVDPARRLAEISLVDADERQRLTVAWNATQRDYARSSTIHALFEAQAERTPDAVAVVFRDQSLTYRDLDRRANVLARQLRTRNAGPGRLVGIFMRRSIDMVVAMLGTLKSGAAYVPLDPAFPSERLTWMLEDSQASIVVTQRDLANAVPAAQQAKILCLDSPLDLGVDGADVDGGAQAHDLAYVIFTSGSSGRPKGVMVEHRNVVNFFAGMDEKLEFREPGTWLAVTSISFDISVLELLWTLTRGFKVVVQDEEWLAPSRGHSPSAARGKMDFSLFYFSADAGETVDNKYRLLLEGSRFADQHGFSAVWTPERHFHAFGGLYPNPSVTSAAIAAITSRVQIRAGSVVLPLHNPIRIAEEWAVVDNLSRGRVGLSFASGWHANDFALMPQNYKDRRELTFQGIEIIRKLWRGEAVKALSGSGDEIEVRIFPAPLQRNPQIWVTAAGNVETFRAAGEMGANLLTNLLGQKTEELAGKIAAYRAGRRERGHPGEGIVSLMLHTFVGTDLEEVRRKVHDPFIDYLKTSTDLIKRARWEFPAFASKRNGQLQGADDELSAEDMEVVMEFAFERYFVTSGLFGTPETCREMVEKLQEIGVNEIACLIDFGVDSDSVLESLTYLNDLRERSNPTEEEGAYSIAAQLRRHQVTHFQCTPSLARILTADRESLAALRPLRKLLLGGEALPASLAAQLIPAIDGDLLNMYGPTETTVWSSAARIGGTDAAIHIGRPIANTQIYLVDRNLNLVPVGVPGELVIGGDGVTRGYLNRPELTDERFVPDPFANRPGARLYRTGDLARYRDDGCIEFLGRIDDQIKVLGHRIEPGEIEATLALHPAVKESLAMVRENAEGERGIVAYVAVGGSNSEASHWRAIWDHTYESAAQPARAVDPTLNTAGWISSYTGQPIPQPEMREWVERTVERIGVLQPKRVLEIGCGFGMLLFRIAPSCERYHGVDFSPIAVRYVQEEADRRGLRNVTVQRAAADEVTGFEKGAFDVVVLNSVIQYFPSVEYLVGVLERVVPLVADGGSIFIGDVRSLPLLDAFHATVELEQAPDDLSTTELRRRVRRRADHETELVLAPDFFRALRSKFPEIRCVDIQLKRGRHHNELTRFRYDAVLRIGGTAAVAAPPTMEPGAGLTLDELRRLLAAQPPVLAFSGIPNSRVGQAARAAELIASDESPATAGEIRRKLNGVGVDPEEIYALDGPYDVELSGSAGAAAHFDAIFRRRSAAPVRETAAPAVMPPRKPWADYANVRKATTTAALLVAELKDLVKQRLPEYMIPSAIVVLENLPRTPNGKLDRKALPEPDRERAVTATPYSPPQNELEQTIARVWQDLLSLDRVGSNDNFFDLGANSLSMMRANARLRDVLQRDLPLVDLFRYPSVSALAAHLAQATDDSVVLDQSQQRGQGRLEALRRRRRNLGE